jgi:hypothetical protein
MTSANSLTSAYISLGLFTFIFFSLVVPQTGTTTISLFCTHLDFRVCILLSLFRSRVLNKEPCNDRSCGQFVWKDFHKLLGSYNSSSLCQRIRPRGEFFVDTDLHFGQLRRFSQLPIFVFLFPGYGGIPGTSIGRNFARDYGWSQGQRIGNISSRCCTRAFFPDVQPLPTDLLTHGKNYPCKIYPTSLNFEIIACCSYSFHFVQSTSLFLQSIAHRFIFYSWDVTLPQLHRSLILYSWDESIGFAVVLFFPIAVS